MATTRPTYAGAATVTGSVLARMCGVFTCCGILWTGYDVSWTIYEICWLFRLCTSFKHVAVDHVTKAAIHLKIGNKHYVYSIRNCRTPVFKCRSIFNRGMCWQAAIWIEGRVWEEAYESCLRWSAQHGTLNLGNLYMVCMMYTSWRLRERLQ